MAQLSSQGNNAIIYLTYIALLASGIFLAWKFAKKENFLSSNGTQKGLPLAVNFIASGMYLFTGVFATRQRVLFFFCPEMIQLRLNRSDSIKFILA